MEMEIGVVGGEEDGVVGEMNEKLYSTPEDALATARKLGTGENGRYLLAATFGNVHGVYKPGHVQLRPSILKDLQDAVAAEVGGDDKPFDLVFHGGSGSSLEEIHEALDHGVVKMNVDTDTQYAFTRPIAAHMFQQLRRRAEGRRRRRQQEGLRPPLVRQGGRGEHGEPRRRGLPEPALRRSGDALIVRKSARDIEGLREAGRVVALAHEAMRAKADVGVTTRDLDEIARDVLREHGATSAFLDYHPHFAPSPFPGVICASVNDVIVHGVARRRPARGRRPGQHRLRRDPRRLGRRRRPVASWSGHRATRI